jgi:hypothetical protein
VGETNKKAPLPLVGEQKSKTILDKWDSEESRRWKIIYFDSCDTTQIFLEVTKLMKSYIEQTIDIWKECVSSPGFCRVILQDVQKQKYFVSFI